MNEIICGDTTEALRTLGDESVDCIITSPPYWGLRNYGVEKQLGLEKTFVEYLENILYVTKELKRILKPGGSLWWNHGDSYANQKVGNQVDSSFKKGKTHLSEKSLLGQPWRVAIRMCDEQGWILRSDIKWIKQILLWKEKRTIGSVMPASAKDRFNNSGEYLFHFVKNKKYYFDLDAVRIKHQTEEHRPQGIDREKDYPNAKRNTNSFSYRVRDSVKKHGQSQFVASEDEIKKYTAPDTQQKMGKDDNRQEWSSRTPNWCNEKGKNIPNAWLIGTEPQKEAHFAMFPTALCEIPILSSCPRGGIVFDPFMGGGSTAVAAKRLGRDYLGIELNPSYIEIAQRRIDRTSSPFL